VSGRLGLVLGETKEKRRAKDTTDWATKAELVLAECHPKQRAFVLDPGRRVCALCARGSGKTTATRARFLRRMFSTHKARCLFIATTRSQAEEFMWAPLKDACEKLCIEATFNETKLKCTFKRNDAQLRLVGADDKREIDKLRGQPFHEVWIDEAASHTKYVLEHLIYRIIGPRLGDFGGMLGLVGTPSHVLTGPFYEATRPGSDKSRRWDDRNKPEFADFKGWSFHAWTMLDGAPHVPRIASLWREALIEKAENQWSDQNPIWRREYLGQWAADDTENVFKFRPHLDDGQAWNVWDPPRRPNGMAQLPTTFTDWNYVYGIDLGHSDPFALVVWAYSPTDTSKTIYQVYEFERRGMYARTIAELLIGEALDSDKPGGVIGATGWPNGMVADREGSGDAILAELANVYGIQIGPADQKNKFDSVELMNGDLVDGRMKILKGSQLAEQMMHLQWAVDDFGKLKFDKSQRNDLCDAAMYGRRQAAHLLAQEAPPPKPRFAQLNAPDEFDEQPEDFTDLLSDGDYRDDIWGN
jgi:hypothetical protein